MNNLTIDKFSPLNSLKLFGLKEHFYNFVKLHKNQKLPKIILLTGEKGIGKFTLIFHFINYVLSLNSKHSYDCDDLLIECPPSIVIKIEPLLRTVFFIIVFKFFY